MLFGRSSFRKQQPGLLLQLHTGLHKGMWPPSRCEAHPKMERIPKGFQTKVSQTFARRSQQQDTSISSRVLCESVGRPAPPEIPLRQSPCQGQLEGAACLTPPCKKQGRKETRLGFDRVRRTIWDSGFAFSFSFERKLQTYDHLDHRAHFNEAPQCGTFISILELQFQHTEALRVNRTSVEHVQQDSAYANLIGLLFLQPRNICCIYCTNGFSRG